MTFNLVYLSNQKLPLDNSLCWLATVEVEISEWNLIQAFAQNPGTVVPWRDNGFLEKERLPLPTNHPPTLTPGEEIHPLSNPS